MNEDRLTRVERATLAATRAGEQASRRANTFYNARNGVSVRMTREEERAALGRCK